MVTSMVITVQYNLFIHMSIPCNSVCFMPKDNFLMIMMTVSVCGTFCLFRFQVKDCN